MLVQHGKIMLRQHENIVLRQHEFSCCGNMEKLFQGNMKNRVETTWIFMLLHCIHIAVTWKNHVRTTWKNHVETIWKNRVDNMNFPVVVSLHSWAVTWHSYCIIMKKSCNVSTTWKFKLSQHNFFMLPQHECHVGSTWKTMLPKNDFFMVIHLDLFILHHLVFFPVLFISNKFQIILQWKRFLKAWRSLFEKKLCNKNFCPWEVILFY